MSSARRAPRAFAHVETWVFDLDNTLYPHHLNLWQQVDERIRDYIAAYLKVTQEEAFRLQKDYYKRYGTSMRGLMTEHGMKPDDFLDFVHQIDHSPLTPNAALGAAIEGLPGRKLILTNGTRRHADAVLARLDTFRHIIDKARPRLDDRGCRHMSHADLAKIIDDGFDQREHFSPATKGPMREAVEAALDLLDRGAARVAEREANGHWRVNQWLKKAVLLSFRLNEMRVISGGPRQAVWWDKITSKFEGWSDARFREAGLRAVPNCVVRHSAYVAHGVVVMPCFVTLGAYVDSGTLIDTWATVGSFAQVGKNCHISVGAGIGGVLELLQARPVVLVKNCFVGV